MRIAIVQETVDTQRGGAETSTRELAGHLAALGVEVTVVYRGERAAALTDERVTYLPIAVAGFSRALRTYRFVQAVPGVCRELRCDVVHAITPCLCADVYQPRGGTFAETVARGLAAVRSPAARAVKRVGRLFNVRQRFLLRLERTLLRRRPARVVVAAVSQYVGRQVTEGYGFPAERTRVIFNGVDVAPLAEGERERRREERRRALGLESTVPLVLFVAHNFKLKGLEALLYAVADGAHAGAEPCHLVVAGRDRPERYRRLAARLGLGERVHFVGAQTPIREWYAAADVLAHPTWYDPCSRVVLEALALGLPVVTTRLNGAAEVMEPGRHGEVIARPADTAALAASLRRALDPAVGAACRADAARLRVELSMARHARELKALYEELATG
jgi:UDP-glucose:(heptosyl)LPS alpha-1,3-glucosyltransferase